MRMNISIAIISILTLLNSDLHASAIFVDKQFVHVHKNKSVNSITVVTIACGKKVKLMSSDQTWNKIKSGSFEGFSLKRNFTTDKPACLGSKYSKFYNQLDLSMTDIYKLGRLEDLFIYGEVQL